MLGLDESDAQRQQLDVYREYFQEPFILATAAYYKAESAAFSSNNSVSDYMKRAETRLQEDVDRGGECPTERSVAHLVADLSQLKETCEKVLIAAHSDLMWDEFQSLLDGDRSDGKHAHCWGRRNC
jgi:cullin 1